MFQYYVCDNDKEISGNDPYLLASDAALLGMQLAVCYSITVISSSGSFET